MFECSFVERSVGIERHGCLGECAHKDGNGLCIGRVGGCLDERGEFDLVAVGCKLLLKNGLIERTRSVAENVEVEGCGVERVECVQAVHVKGHAELGVGKGTNSYVNAKG